MTKTRSTKRALLTSGLVLIMCITMLIGTTFAWFTDSVTSGRNQIVAGNLDVELEYWNGTAYAPVTSATKLFNDDALWEPGYTEVAYLKVSNLGSLALKYQLNVNVFGETLGKTKGGADIKLSDHLVFKTVESDTDLADTYATREAAVAAAGTEKGLKAYNGATKPLDPKGGANADDYVALIIYMPTTVDNEANHNGTDVPYIEMGVNLLATQLTAEEDSFNNQYDKDAEFDVEVSTIDDLANALAVGENIVLTDDITVTAENKLGTSYGFLTYYSSIDGGGNTITDESASRVSAFYAGNIEYIRNLTLKTNSAYAIFTASNDMSMSNVTIEKSSEGAVIYAEGAKNLILDDVNATGTGTGATASAAHAIVFATGPKGSSNVTVNSGTYTATDANGYAVASFYGSVVTINGGTFTGNLTTDGTGKIVIKGGTFNVDPSAYVANGYAATKNADGTYTVVEGTAVANATDLAAALAAGGNVVLADDIELTGTLMAKKDVVINLNGKTITAPSNGAMFQSQSNAAPSLTITSSAAGAKINACEIKSSNYTTFKVYGDLTLGEGTVVNVDYLGTSLISNNAKKAIVIDGAKINVGTFKVNSGAMISLTSGTTLALKDTDVNVGLDTTYTSYFISKAENATIENCTFDIKNLDGTKEYDIVFKPDASVGAKYAWVQK